MNPQCTIASHHHGAKLQRGFTECQGRREFLMHHFSGKEVVFEGVDNCPLVECSRCHIVAAYMRCTGDTY